ncbi:MAG: uracil-DNA glycosylase [Chloroflexi bacterium]|nr:uracil-DNA glycosylase [Chloroflexota bacterium]MCY3589891.1 uracil-DNA glycosylase [Chloroflexota bacterium]MCY3685281.1 uracil-DNA glycosylase [Chloroflexota bacterium]MDE2707236.1 uracil-DNA glycosylase [Chloroflexota bacterium]
MDPQRLELLNAKIAGCTACRLHEGRTQTVPGNGDPNAELMFIGEAPGQNEDQQGLPFVGRAGQLLDELLGEIGFARSDVFVANVLKCRPPGNRDPQPDEIGCCEVYLREQIEGIRPKLIVLLGLFATQYFLPDAKMGETRGQPHQAGPWLILPVYHPAAALRNSNLMSTMREDFAVIPPLLAQAERPEVQRLQIGHQHAHAAEDDDSQRSLL